MDAIAHVSGGRSALPAKIGVVGLGAMGVPIARALVKAGHRVSVWDVDNTAREGAARGGVPLAPSLQSLLSESRIVLVTVGSEDATRRVLDEAFKVMASGSIQVVLGTISPELATDLDGLAKRSGQRVLNAPLCRAVRGVEAGQALALVSGDRATIDECRSVLGAFCSDIVEIGSRPGDSQIAKSINNLLLWASVLAVEEAASLALAAGLDFESLRAFLSTSTADSWALREWAHVGEWTWAIKDLTLLQAHASSLGLPVPLASELARLAPTSTVLSHAADSHDPVPPAKREEA